jgi:hypothetical protein
MYNIFNKENTETIFLILFWGQFWGWQLHNREKDVKVSGVIKSKEGGVMSNIISVVQGGGNMPHGSIVLCRISMFFFVFGTFGKGFITEKSGVELPYTNSPSSIIDYFS